MKVALVEPARYSQRVAKLMGNNSVLLCWPPCFCCHMQSCFVQSLQFSVLKYPNGQKAVWSADGNLEYLGAKHTPVCGSCSYSPVSVAALHSPTLLGSTQNLMHKY